MATIRLKTKVITDDRPVYGLFPGEGYRFFNAMKEGNIVFLDFPLLNPPEAGQALSQEYKSALVRSEKIAEWEKSRQEARPSENPADYVDARWSARRTRYANAMDTLFNNMRTGDLVAVPSDDIFGEVLVGEIQTDRQMDGFTTAPYGNASKIAFRRIKWIGRRAIYKISEELLRSLRTPGPIVHIERSRHLELFDIAYDSYYHNDIHKSKFYVKALSSKEDWIFSTIVNFSAAVAAANDDGVAVDSRRSIYEIVSQFDNLEFQPDVSASINSPGFISLASDKIVPLLVSALIALAISACEDASPNEVELPNPDELQLIMRDGEIVPCALRVRDLARDGIRMMGLEQWREFCNAVKLLEERSALEAPAAVEN